MLEHLLERRVGHESSIPIGLAVDLDRRKSRRQRAARHHVVGADLLIIGVEILQVAGEHLDRADAEAHRSGIQKVEIDKLEQSVSERSRVVDADRFSRSLRAQHGRGDARREEARHARQRCERGARLVKGTAGVVIVGERPAREPARYAVPEGAQALDASLRRVAGDDGRIDRADRDACDPARHLAGFCQSLVSARLIGAERAAALQHEDRLLVERCHGARTTRRRSLRLWPSPPGWR